MLPLVVVGGGVSGLSTAYYLSKLSKLANRQIGKIVVLESSNRFGGWVDTVQNDRNGVLHELGPRSLRRAGKSGENTLQLIAELGLVNDVLVKSPKDPGVRNRYIAVEDKLFAIPNSFPKLFLRQKPLSKSMLRYTLAECRTPRLDLSKQTFEQLGDEKSVIDRNRQLLNESELEDISVHEFFKLRIAKDFADYLIDPMLRGITSGDARTLSVRSLFSQFFENERAHGSVIKGSFKAIRGSKAVKEERAKQMFAQWNMPDKLKNIRQSSVWSFQEGMAQLPRTLADRLASDPNVELRKGNRLTGFELDAERRLTLNVTPNGVDGRSYQIKADQVFFAVNAQDLANLIAGKDDQLSLLKSTLSSIESATVATVNLEFAQRDLLKSTPGFGLLIPSHVNTSILGVIFESLLFPQLDRSNEITRLSVMAGGDWFAQLCVNGQVDESKLIEKSLEVLSKYLKISQEPSFMKINVLRNCIPQYRVGHYLKLKLLDSLTSNLKLSLVGSSYRGISLNDCIFYGKEAANAYLASCESQAATGEPTDSPQL